jgi:hypothetical protein
LKNSCTELIVCFLIVSNKCHVWEWWRHTTCTNCSRAFHGYTCTCTEASEAPWLLHSHVTYHKSNR